MSATFKTPTGYELDMSAIKGMVLKTKMVNGNDPWFEDVVQEVAIAMWKRGAHVEHAVADALRKHGPVNRTGHRRIENRNDTIRLDSTSDRAEEGEEMHAFVGGKDDVDLDRLHKDEDTLHKIKEWLSPHEQYIVLGVLNGVPSEKLAADLLISAPRASQIFSSGKARIRGEKPPYRKPILRERGQTQWGRSWDTPKRRRKEVQALQMIADGMKIDEIADKWGVTRRTVTQYIDSANRRMGARNRTQAVAEAMRRGLIK